MSTSRQEVERLREHVNELRQTLRERDQEVKQLCELVDRYYAACNIDEEYPTFFVTVEGPERSGKSYLVDKIHHALAGDDRTFNVHSPSLEAYENESECVPEDYANIVILERNDA